MHSIDELASAVFSAEEFADLSEAQFDAVAEALVLALGAETTISAAEVDLLGIMLLNLPRASGAPRRRVAETIRHATASIERAVSGGGDGELMRSIAARLPCITDRERVFRMAGAIYCLDGDFQRSEQELLARMAAAFEIAPGRAQSVLDELCRRFGAGIARDSRAAGG